MTRARPTLYIPLLLAWQAVCSLAPACASEGFQPPALGTRTTYRVEGSYSGSTALTGDAFTDSLDCTCELIAFGSEQSPRYLVTLLDVKDSEMIMPGVPQFLTERDAIWGGRVFVAPLLLPENLSSGDLANGRRLLTCRDPFFSEFQLECDVDVGRRDGRTVVHRRMADESMPVRVSRSGRILRWDEHYVLDSRDGQLLGGRISSAREITRFGDLISVLEVDVQLSKLKTRPARNLDSEVLMADARRLQQINQSFRTESSQNPDPARRLRQRLSSADRFEDELRQFSKERPNSLLSSAIPSMRRYVDDARTELQSWLDRRVGFEALQGVPAPDFTLKTLQGESLALSEAIRGKVALISFWHYSCGPCRVEVPHLVALYEKYKEQGFVILAVNAWNDPKELVERYVKQTGMTYPVLLDGKEVAEGRFHVTGYPSTFWIDHRGRINDCYDGFEPGDEQVLEEKLKELLTARSGATTALD